MKHLPDHPSPQQAEQHFRELLRKEALAQPDEVEHDSDADELIFRWRERKLAVVIELSDRGPTDVRMRPCPRAA